MNIKTIKYGDALRELVIVYAKECSWSAGALLEKQMQENEFADWERVLKWRIINGKDIRGSNSDSKESWIENQRTKRK